MGGVEVTVRLKSLKQNLLCLCVLKLKRWPHANSGFCGGFSGEIGPIAAPDTSPRKTTGEKETIKEVRGRSESLLFG